MKLIHEFISQIYPIRLWVAIAENTEGFIHKFSDVNHDPIHKDVDKHMAFSMQVKDKNDYWGILLFFRSDYDITPGLMAHEATHAARDIWDRISEHETGCEADAYLVEWIVNCIDEVKTKFSAVQHTKSFAETNNNN